MFRAHTRGHCLESKNAFVPLNPKPSLGFRVKAPKGSRKLQYEYIYIYRLGPRIYRVATWTLWEAFSPRQHVLLVASFRWLCS